MRRLIQAAILLIAASTAVAATFDDPQQRQRFDAVVEQLNQDADPNDVIPMVYDYMEYYIWIGYSDPAEADPDGDIERTFGNAYTGYFARLADRLNKRLGQCDPTVMDEIMEYIEFHEVGYSDGRILSDRERIEKSVFWSGYVEWEANDALRDLIDGGDTTGPSVMYPEALELLRSGKPKEKTRAARSLGAVQIGSDLTVEAVLGHLNDASSVVRYWVVATLSRYVEEARNVAPQLRKALTDHSWPVRIKAAALLGQLDDAPSRKQARSVLDASRKSHTPWPEKRSPGNQPG